MKSLIAFAADLARAALVLAVHHFTPEPEDDFWADWAREVDALADVELAEMTGGDQS